jgi:2'-5' RNA ligase
VIARDTVGGDERIRLFLALEVPDEVAVALAEWGREHLRAGRRVRIFHVTLAFLDGQPQSRLAGIVDVLRREAASTDPFELEPLRYRETRSVGMLVLDDRSGRAKSLAERVQSDLEDLGVYERERRRWLPHLTVLRFRERPRLEPPLPAVGAFVPSGAAAFLSRLHPTGARYEVLESCALGSPRKGLEAGG